MRKLNLIIFLFLGVATQAMADSWMIRFRGINVDARPSSSVLTTIGGTVNEINNKFVPELDFSYFINDNFAVELIAGTARHSVVANGTSLGRVALGKVSLLPPTLTVQYHHQVMDVFKPYVGIGVNYTKFYDVDTGPTATDIQYQNTTGMAFQAGLDYMFAKNWYFNADIKKIYIRPDVNVVAGALIQGKVKIDPLVYGIGVGVRF